MFRINLLPPDEKHELNIKEIAIVVAFIVFIGAMGILYVINFYQTQILTTELSNLQMEYLRYQEAVKKVDEAEAKKAELEKRLVLRDLFTVRLSWAELLKELAYCIPGRLAFDTVNISRYGVLDLEGETTDHHQVSVFMDNLEDSDYFSDVRLVQSTSSWQGDFRLTRFLLGMDIVMEEDL